MKITVVTVCRNAGSIIEKTIKSVLMQKGSDYEYIIQDGFSDDNTLCIAKAYENEFKKSNILYRVESEMDDGIYDAMNKAIDKGSGEWIFFLNAGDMFYNDEILDDFIKMRGNLAVDLVYGHTNYIFSDNKELVVVRNHEDVFKGAGICQQSLFYRRKMLEKRKFNMNYKILADYEYLLYMNEQNCQFSDMNLIVSNYGYNGISSINCSQVYKEKMQIMKEYGITYKMYRPDIYLKIKEKMIVKFPSLNTLQVVRTEMKRRS